MCVFLDIPVCQWVQACIEFRCLCLCPFFNACVCPGRSRGVARGWVMKRGGILCLVCLWGRMRLVDRGVFLRVCVRMAVAMPPWLRWISQSAADLKWMAACRVAPSWPNDFWHSSPCSLTSEETRWHTCAHAYTHNTLTGAPTLTSHTHKNIHGSKPTPLHAQTFDKMFYVLAPVI